MTPDPLLDAVFGPGEDILRPALKAARRRRVRRAILRSGCAVACVAAVASLLIPHTPLGSPRTADLSDLPPAPRGPGIAIVVTAGLAPLESISTRPLAVNEVVHTRSNSVQMVSTTNAASPPAIIADAELLALFETGRVALVGRGAELRLVQY